MDFRQSLYNHDGRLDESWTSPLHGWLSVDGKPINTPNPGTTRFLGRPSTDSLDVALTTHSAVDDYTCIQLKLFARGLKLEDPCIGYILVWAIDIESVETSIHDEQSARNKTKAFSDET